MRGIGADRHLPAEPGAGVDAHVLQDDGEEPRRHLLAGGDHGVVFAGVVQDGGGAAERHELVGLPRHGRDDDRDLVAGIDLAPHVARHVADAVEVGDGGSAEFHHETGHAVESPMSGCLGGRVFAFRRMPGASPARGPATRGSLSASGAAGNISANPRAMQPTLVNRSGPRFSGHASHYLHREWGRNTASGAATIVGRGCSWRPRDRPVRRPQLRSDRSSRSRNSIRLDGPASQYPSRGMGLAAGFVERFWTRALSSSDDRTVWYSRRYAKEYAGFLEWVTRAGDLPYNVVDLSECDVEPPKGQRCKLVSLSQVSPEWLDMRRFSRSAGRSAILSAEVICRSGRYLGTSMLHCACSKTASWFPPRTRISTA